MPDSAIAADATRYASKHILFVGVDWERKGGPELLEAFRRVLQVHPDAQLTIVGCSPQVSLPQCHVVGRIPPEQLNRYFDEAAIFCMPTRNEPFGIVFIEAGMHWLPIVSTNIGAVPEMVCDGLSGHLVNPGDVEGLTQALVDLLNNPHKGQKFGQYGFEHMQRYYTWEHTGRLMRSHIAPYISQPVLDVDLV
jgi:glycosyltransferase involved in cell wall biosynthesis